MIKKLFFAVFLIINVNLLAQTAFLNNFRVENTNKDRVYFDASGDISGLTTQGFVISGKTITAVNTTQNYFMVSVPFTFWDNNTIRLEKGDGAVRDFTLTYIKNNIPEPNISGSVYYVDAAMNTSGNGLSEENAFKTIQEGVNIAKSGDKVWIKAGYYGAENVQTINAGNSSNPIIFEGYRLSPGDIKETYYNPYSNENDITSESLRSSEMPLLDGGDRLSGFGFNIHSSDNYLIIKNIQITNYYYGIGGTGMGINHINLINIICKDLGSGSVSDSGEAFMFVGSGSNDFNRFINCVAINGAHRNFTFKGEFNLTDNCKSYSDENGYDVVSLETDYYYYIVGFNNIVRNSLSDRRHSKGFGGHGFGTKYTSEYNLIENCLAINMASPFKARHLQSQFNVFKNNEAHANVSYRRVTGYKPGGVVSEFAASFNIFENNYIHDVDYAFSLSGSNEKTMEDSKTWGAGEGNIWRNNLVVNVNSVLSARNINKLASQEAKDNLFYNNTIHNANYIFSLSSENGLTFSGNKFVNNIFSEVDKFNVTGASRITPSSSDFKFDYNVFHHNSDGVGAQGANDFVLDPQFMDLANNNFRLKPTSDLIDKGLNLIEVKSDKDNNPRPSGLTNDIGAYEVTTPLIGYVSPDVSICWGESTILTASGGTSYVWNTGETTASITVSPSTTTTYTVTISDGTNSDSHDVIVTLNEPPSVNLGSDQTICSGENITLTANGVGNFLWSTGETTSSITVSPTDTTTYTVTASSSCTDDATDQVIVNVTPGVNLALGSDVDICLGESITLTAQSNGNFLWNTGETTAVITVSPTSTTIYSVTSSLGDCSKTEEVSVTVNQAPSVNAGSDQTICEGESAILTATGEGDFLWSTGETTASITVNPTTTTTYSVTASNSCSTDATDQVIVTVNDKPTVSVSNDIIIENGSSTVLTASGDGNFLWSTGETTSSITVSPSITTTYSVTLTSQVGCSETNSIEVSVTNSSGTTVTADAGPDQDVCLEASVELTASGGDNYLWSTGEVTASIIVKPSETTTYTVTVSNGNSIDVDDVTVYVDENCSEIANRPLIQEFKVYPNPTNGILHIELSGYSNELNISLFNATGKIIHSEIISNYSLDKSLKRNINLRRFGKGVYYAIITNNGKNDTKKVIVM